MSKLNTQTFVDGLTNTCNIGLLHPLDKRRIIDSFWYLSLKNVEIDEDEIHTALEEKNWNPKIVRWVLGALAAVKEISSKPSPDYYMNAEFLDDAIE